MFYVVGLGNPGVEYENSRHNAGRMAILRLQKDLNLTNFKFNTTILKTRGKNKKIEALVAKIKINNKETILILPQNFMNKSGDAVSFFVKPKNIKNKAENLIVVHDDLDLPIGTVKISYNKGSGGHKGLESIIKSIKTKAFVRVRIGISPSTLKGTIKKPGLNLPTKVSEKAVLNFILGKFKPSEMEILKKVFKKTSKAIQTIITIGHEMAMNQFNG